VLVNNRRDPRLFRARSAELDTARFERLGFPARCAARPTSPGGRRSPPARAPGIVKRVAGKSHQSVPWTAMADGSDLAGGAAYGGLP